MIGQPPAVETAGYKQGMPPAFINGFERKQIGDYLNLTLKASNINSPGQSRRRWLPLGVIKTPISTTSVSDVEKATSSIGGYPLETVKWRFIRWQSQSLDDPSRQSLDLICKR